MKTTGRIHVLRSATGEGGERWAYLVTFHPTRRAVGSVPELTCLGIGQLRSLLRRLGTQAEALERTVKEAEQGHSNTLELSVDRHRLRGFDLIY